MEAETPDGRRHSVLLQNAETVRLIGPGKPFSVLHAAVHMVAGCAYTEESMKRLWGKIACADVLTWCQSPACTAVIMSQLCTPQILMQLHAQAAQKGMQQNPAASGKPFQSHR